MVGVEEMRLSEMIPDLFWYFVMSIITYGVITNEIRVRKFAKIMKDDMTRAQMEFDREAGI